MPKKKRHHLRNIIVVLALILTLAVIAIIVLAVFVGKQQRENPSGGGGGGSQCTGCPSCTDDYDKQIVQIRDLVAQGSCLDNDGNNVYLGGATSNNQYQQWTLYRKSDGSYQIYNAKTAKCLAPYYLNGDPTKTSIKMVDSGSADSFWRLTTTKNVQFTSVKYNTCLDSDPAKVNYPSSLYVNPCSIANLNQQWFFIPA